MNDIHVTATRALPPSKVPAFLAELKEILKAQPALIAQAVKDVVNP